MFFIPSVKDHLPSSLCCLSLLPRLLHFFLPLCVEEEARVSWNAVFCCGNLKQRYKYSFTGSGVTNSSTKTSTIGSSSRGLYDSANVKSSISKIKGDTIPRNELSKEEIFTKIPLSDIKDEREDINAHVTTFTGSDQPAKISSEKKTMITVKLVAIAVSRYCSEIKISPTVYCSAIITVVVT